MSYLVLKRGMTLSHSIDDYPEGIVVAVDKPYRWTSADVIRKVKWMAVKHFRKKNLKVGHAGTLDPLATGVLLVCIGKATKLAEQLQKEPKQYLAGVTFGATTASYDREKDVDAFFPLDGVSEKALQAALPSFLGEQDQVAPLFSAKSVDGVRVYELARKRYKAGLPVEEPGLLQASRINIYGLELVSFSKSGIAAVDCVDREACPSERRATLGNVRGRGQTARLGGMSGGAANRIGGTGSPATQQPASASNRINVAEIPAGLPQAEILVDCSKGTYIRALARDLGEALGSGAFLHSLRRTKNGGFVVEEALSIEDLGTIFWHASN